MADKYQKRGLGQQEGILQGPIAQVADEGFVGFGKTGQIPEQYRTKMYDDYGFRMSKGQYEEAEKNREAMEADIDTFRSDYNDRIAEAKEKYGTAESNFHSTVSDAERKLGKTPTPESIFNKWYNREKKIAVRVVSGDNIETTKYVPLSVIQEFDKTKGDFNGGFVDKGKAYNIEVRQGGRIRGKEMHEFLNSTFSKENMLNTMKKDEKFAEGYAKAVKEYGTAKSQLDAAKAQGKGMLATYRAQIADAAKERDHQIQLVRTRRQAMLDEIRERREKVSKRAKLAYGRLAQTMRTK